MYINVILEKSELLLPKPRAPEQHGAQPGAFMAEDTGILTAWDGLRIGYFWGGNNETVLRINASDISAVCHVPTMQQPQACTIVYSFFLLRNQLRNCNFTCRSAPALTQ